MLLWKCVVCAIVVGILGLTADVGGQSVGVVCAYKHQVGLAGIEGSGDVVAVDGNTVYITTSVNGVQIVDIATPTKPRFIANFRQGIDDYPTDIYAESGLLYIADDRSGLEILDVSDPADPQLVSTFRVGAGAEGVKVRSDIAYLACGEFALQIVDVVNPEQPVLLSSFAHNGNVTDLDVAGDLACLAVGGLGVELVDISDPVNPQLLSEFTGLEDAVDVAIHGHHLFVADGRGGFSILDITDRSSPVRIAMVDPGNVRKIKVEGDRAYVLTSERVLIYDIADPSNPKDIGVNELHKYPVDIYVRDDTGIVVGGGMVRIVDLVSPTRSAFVSRTGTFGDRWFSNAITLNGDLIYLLRDTSEMRVVDISDPFNPVLVSQFSIDSAFGDSVREAHIRGDYLYMATNYSGLKVLDISDPAKPSLVGGFDVGQEVYGLEMKDNVAFVTDLSTGLWAIDVSNPADPTLLGRYDMDVRFFRVTAVEDLLLVPLNQPSRLRLLDASDPSNMQLVGEVSHPSGGGDASVYKNWAYLPAGFEGIHILDISNPELPKYVDSISKTTRPQAIQIRGQRMYVADALAGVAIYDLQKPDEPRLIGVYGSAYNPELVELYNNYVVTADGGFGIEFIDISESCSTCPADTDNDGSLTPADFTAWVNAFNSNLPGCDQNADGFCTPTDFTAWIANFNAGC